MSNIFVVPASDYCFDYDFLSAASVEEGGFTWRLWEKLETKVQIARTTMKETAICFLLRKYIFLLNLLFLF